MAKVILVSPQLTENVQQLAQGLALQKHQVTIVTSYDAVPTDELKNVEVLTFFKKWNIFEALRIAPLTLSFQPQIVHFITDNAEVSRGFLTFFTYAKAHPTTKTSLSLMALQPGDLKKKNLRWLLSHSDLISCPRLEELSYLRGFQPQNSQQIRFILPPFLPGLKNTMASSLSPKEPSLIGLPPLPRSFDLSHPWFQFFSLIYESHPLSVQGDWIDWPLRQRKSFANWTQNLQSQNRWNFESPSFPSAQVIWLAGLPLSPSVLSFYFQKSLQNHITLILDQKQAQLHAGFWKHGETCWILSEKKILADGRHLLNQSQLDLSQNLKKSQPELTRWIDLPLNELTRLYNKALMNI